MRRVLRVPFLAPPSASEALRALVLARLVAYEALRVHFFFFFLILSVRTEHLDGTPR